MTVNKIFSIVLVLWSLGVSAQTPQQILRDYKVPPKFLNDLFEENYLDQYAFKIKITDTDKEKKKREKILSYDPKRGSGAKWKLLSVNGSKPTADEQKEETQLNAQEGKTQTKKGDLVEEQKIKLISENEKQIVLKFSFSENGLPESFSFLADNVPGFIYLNKADKTLDRILIKSEESFRVKLVAKIESFSLDIKYQREANKGIYVPKTENLNFKMSAFGMNIDQNSFQEYFDYQITQ